MITLNHYYIGQSMGTWTAGDGDEIQCSIHWTGVRTSGWIPTAESMGKADTRREQEYY